MVVSNKLLTTTTGSLLTLFFYFRQPERFFALSLSWIGYPKGLRLSEIASTTS
ncbi:MAG: hypothetical protein IJM09_01545 [Neisseriaceae bacterium]|nr:hypothetical protein [Neisseriaceae bacterium]